MKRFLDADQPATLEALRARIRRFRDHYNCRPHQALDQATPATAWKLLDHTPATKPIPLTVLEAKAAQYRQALTKRQTNLDKAALAITKTGQILPNTTTTEQTRQGMDQTVVEVTKANRQVYYQGKTITLPSPYGGHSFYRTITNDTFFLIDMQTGEIVFEFPLPMVALNAHGRYIHSYAIRGVTATLATPQWKRKHANYQAQFQKRQTEQPETFT